jgi:hypothetical protein
MRDNPYAAPHTQVLPATDHAPQTPRPGRQVALDVLGGLRYFLIRGIPTAALATCLFMAAASALDGGQWGAATLLQMPALHLFAFAGAVAYFPVGLCVAVLASLLRPRLRRSPGRRVALSLAVCLPVGLLEWMLFPASPATPHGSWLSLFFIAPLLPVPLLLWLFARPQRLGQSVDPV